MDAKLKKIFDGRGKKYHNLISGTKLPTVDEVIKKLDKM